MRYNRKREHLWRRFFESEEARRSLCAEYQHLLVESSEREQMYHSLTDVNHRRTLTMKSEGRGRVDRVSAHIALSCRRSLPRQPALGCHRSSNGEGDRRIWRGERRMGDLNRAERLKREQSGGGVGRGFAAPRARASRRRGRKRSDQRKGVDLGMCRERFDRR